MNSAFQKALFEGKIPRAWGATIKNVRVRQPAKNSPTNPVCQKVKNEESRAKEGPENFSS